MNGMLELQITMFALIIVGLIIRKKGIVTKTGQKELTALVINLILPCNILKAFSAEGSNELAGKFWMILLISLLIQIGSVLLGRITFPRQERPRRACLQYAIICSNAGFLGNPIAEGLYGTAGLAMASIYLLPLRIMMWSEGVAIFTEAPDKKSLVKKVATHPCIIACAIGLVLMVTGYQIPGFLGKTVGYISSCNTGISMLVIGMILAEADPKALMDKTIFQYALIRLLLIPALVFIPCRLLVHDSMVVGLSVILAGMPAGATTTILASNYDGDEEFAVKLVVLSTALSIITIPLWEILLTVL